MPGPTPESVRLGDHHFLGSSGKLTEAGELKVRWIVEQVPRHHRAIFVRQAATPEETAANAKVAKSRAANTAGHVPNLGRFFAPATDASKPKVEDKALRKAVDHLKAL